MLVDAGSNAVNGTDCCWSFRNIEFWIYNTDVQSSARMAQTTNKDCSRNSKLTKGLGAGGNPETGKAAAEEERWKRSLKL